MNWRLGEVRLFLWTHGVTIRGLCVPGLLVLLALGWIIEAIDDRYGSFLLSRTEPTATE